MCKMDLVSEAHEKKCIYAKASGSKEVSWWACRLKMEITEHRPRLFRLEESAVFAVGQFWCTHCSLPPPQSHLHQNSGGGKGYPAYKTYVTYTQGYGGELFNSMTGFPIRSVWRGNLRTVYSTFKYQEWAVCHSRGERGEADGEEANYAWQSGVRKCLANQWYARIFSKRLTTSKGHKLLFLYILAGQEARTIDSRTSASCLTLLECISYSCYANCKPPFPFSTASQSPVWTETSHI